jgi:hypothetical protein
VSAALIGFDFVASAITFTVAAPIAGGEIMAHSKAVANATERALSFPNNERGDGDVNDHGAADGGRGRGDAGVELMVNFSEGSRRS